MWRKLNRLMDVWIEAALRWVCTGSMSREELDAYIQRVIEERMAKEDEYEKEALA